MKHFIKKIRDYLLAQAFLDKTPEMKGILPWWYLSSVHKVDPFALLFLSPDSKLSDWQTFLMLNSGRHFKDIDYLLINSFFNKKVDPPIKNEIGTQTGTNPLVEPVAGGSRRKSRKTRRSSKKYRYRRRSHH